MIIHVLMRVFMGLNIYPTPPPLVRSIFKRICLGLNLEFSFYQTDYTTKVTETSLPYDVSIAWGKIVEYMSFPLVLCEM